MQLLVDVCMHACMHAAALGLHMLQYEQINRNKIIEVWLRFLLTVYICLTGI